MTQSSPDQKFLLYFADLDREERQRRREVREHKAIKEEICAKGTFEEKLPEQKAESMIDTALE